MSTGLDLFGFVVRDVHASMRELTPDVLDCDWSDVSQGRMELRHGEKEIHPDMTFAFPLGSDRGQIELSERVPDTVWELPEGVDLHFDHLGYWTDRFAGDSADLAGRGRRW